MTEAERAAIIATMQARQNKKRMGVVAVRKQKKSTPKQYRRGQTPAVSVVFSGGLCSGK